MPRKNTTIYANLNTTKEFKSSGEVCFASTTQRTNAQGKPIPLKGGMKTIAAKVANGTFIPYRPDQDDLTENPLIGVYYMPVRLVEIDDDAADVVHDTEDVLDAHGQTLNAKAAASVNTDELPV